MKYIRINFGSAVPMTIQEAEENGYSCFYSCYGYTYGDGYGVSYEDNAKYWYPKEVFEQYNYPIKNEELARTSIGMVSPDYKERFKAEYIQLKNRLEGLQRMLNAWDNGKLNFQPTCPRDLYNVQETAMSMYLDVLKRRAIIEDVKLDN